MVQVSLKLNTRQLEELLDQIEPQKRLKLIRKIEQKTKKDIKDVSVDDEYTNDEIRKLLKISRQKGKSFKTAAGFLKSLKTI